MTDEAVDRYREQLIARGFEPRERLGRGSSGIVFKALQPSVQRLVAIKIFSTINRADEAMKKRFRRESAILGKLDHPNIPFVLTAGELKGVGESTPYHAMQYVEGESLSDVLSARGRLPFPDACDLICPILDALAHAAQAGIVHRDVAPDNVLLTKSGRVFLVDFSLGVLLVPEQPGFTRATEAGRHLGRAQYSAPEQRKDAASATALSDVFAAGVLLHEMMTGTPEVRSSDLEEALPEVPGSVRQVLRAVLSEDPSRRPTAAEFRLALERPASMGPDDRNPSPSTAICVNAACRSPERVRSERGYLRSPTILEVTVDLHCSSCGARLVRRCPGCRSALAGDVKQFFLQSKKGRAHTRLHCGQFGRLLCEVPLCRRCGSLLRDNDLDRDTSLAGCAKCPEPLPPSDEAPF